MEIIKCDKKAGMKLIEILELQPKCFSCKNEITENNFGGVFNKRVCCNSLLCMAETIDENI